MVHPFPAGPIMRYGIAEGASLVCVLIWWDEQPQETTKRPKYLYFGCMLPFKIVQK
jgi:hypothetical protein